ncbi:SDR family NAD(P)-dependent oxidoreductase [soil metagenome]
MDRIIFITGATSGIGKACALKFAANGDHVILNGRRKERLDELQQQISKEYGVKVWQTPFDVQNREAVNAGIEALPAECKKIDVLINNAGLALGRNYFDEADVDDWDTMMQTNVNGLLYVSKALLPLLISNRRAHILNVGSVAGKEIYEKGNVYCASKFAVDAISKSMRIDLLRHKIKVTAIHPGAVKTEFAQVRFKGDMETAEKTYTGFKPLSPDDVADAIFYCTSVPENVCINDLVITCTAQADAIHFLKQ